PDPSSTPIALSIASARTYYTDRGETWERAAMIKARPAAGDLALGHAFLNSLTPFVWPDRVDFLDAQGDPTAQAANQRPSWRQRDRFLRAQHQDWARRYPRDRVRCADPAAHLWRHRSLSEVS